MKLSFALMISACSPYSGSAISHRSQRKQVAAQKALETATARPALKLPLVNGKFRLRMVKPNRRRQNQYRIKTHIANFLKNHLKN